MQVPGLAGLPWLGYTWGVFREDPKMVTRNRKFPTPHGYSRNYIKRDTRQLLTEELNEPSNRLTGKSVSPAPPRPSRVAFEVQPAESPRTGLDLSGLPLDRFRPERSADSDAWWIRVSLSVIRWISWR